MTEFIQVVTTVDSEEGAEAIGRRLLEARLAACVQVAGPVSSSYWWKGGIETADEWTCTVKSRAGLFGEIEHVIREEHPYEEPEILATPLVAGSAGFLAWMEETLMAC